MQIQNKYKALAGAIAGLVTAVGNHFADGGDLATVIASGEDVVQILVSMAIGYAVVYFAKANKENAEKVPA